MTVAQTSLFAYGTIKDLGDKQQKVYDKIDEMQPCSNEQIAKALGWPINRVTGRVTELSKLGVIEVIEIGLGTTGRPVKLWGVK